MLKGQRPNMPKILSRDAPDEWKPQYPLNRSPESGHYKNDATVPISPAHWCPSLLGTLENNM